MSAGIHEVQLPGDRECPCFQAGFLILLVRCGFVLRPGQVEIYLPPTRARFQPLWGKPRGGKGRMSFDILPRSRPLCRKTKFSTDAADSLLAARRCDFKARPNSARDIPPNSGTGPNSSVRAATWVKREQDQGRKERTHGDLVPERLLDVERQEALSVRNQ